MTKRSMYPFHSFVSRRQRLTEGVSERGALKKYLNCLTVLLYTVMYIPFGTNDGSFIRNGTNIIHGVILRHSKIPFFFFSPVSCLNKLFLDLLFFTWLGGSDAG